MRVRVEKENPKDDEHYPSKSKRLLKALLSRHKSKKDDMLYTYLDEYQSRIREKHETDVIAKAGA